jgi:formylglycine-generating enzyme required for sulfatase activity
MIRKYLAVFAALAAVYCLIACGQKEKQEEEVEAVEEIEVPEVNPGDMVLIPAGEFIMGTDEDKDSIAYPAHKVNLPAYWIDKYEVTNKQFLDFTIDTGYIGEGAKEGRDWRLFFTPDKAFHPVVYISWNDAQAYCEWAGKRLPTEEEWEKAARGPNGNIFPWGNEWDMNRTNTYEMGANNFAPVGQYNDVSYYGVNDMFGNVQEWTGSWYNIYKGNPKRDPKAGKQLRIIKGSSARYRGRYGHFYDRSAQPPSALYDIGCRCAKDATPEEAEKAQQSE